MEISYYGIGYETRAEHLNMMDVSAPGSFKDPDKIAAAVAAKTAELRDSERLTPVIASITELVIVDKRGAEVLNVSDDGRGMCSKAFIQKFIAKWRLGLDEGSVKLSCLHARKFLPIVAAEYIHTQGVGSYLGRLSAKWFVDPYESVVPGHRRSGATKSLSPRDFLKHLGVDPGGVKLDPASLARAVQEAAELLELPWE